MITPEEGERSVIYLVRHGESMANIAQKNLSPAESFLTENGKYQSKLFGEFLKNEKFTAAFASTYPRAIETAQIVLAQSVISKDIPLQKTPNIRERDFGIYEDGVDYSVAFKAFGESGQKLVDWVVEGGETRSDIESRIESFLQEIFLIVDESDEVQTILAVTHCELLIHFFTYLYCTPSKYTFKNWLSKYFKMSANTGYFKIAIHKNNKQTSQPLEPRELEILSAHENEHLISLEAAGKVIKEEDDSGSYVACLQQ